MGCASSSTVQQGAAERSKQRHTDYVSQVESLTSAQVGLYREFDARTASHFSDADEPAPDVLALRLQSVINRGKIVGGINADPDQFDGQLDIPQFRKKDRKRVSDWISDTASENPDGPDFLPYDTFILAVVVEERKRSDHNLATCRTDTGDYSHTEESMDSTAREKSGRFHSEGGASISSGPPTQRSRGGISPRAAIHSATHPNFVDDNDVASNGSDNAAGGDNANRREEVPATAA